MSGHYTARVLIYTHRWLGIAIGLLFILWFLSGIVMMYARMPVLHRSERLARATAIAPETIRVGAPSIVDGVTRFAIVTVEGRPAYRLTSNNAFQFVFADTGDDVPPVDREQALRIAKRFAGVGGVQYEARLTDADQWTFDVRTRTPMHRIAVEDAAGTRLYVSEAGGEVVGKTTTVGRRWGWLGAVVHWLYFAPFRRSTALWASTIIALSIAGTVLCAVGLVWGIWRVAPIRGYCLRSRRQWTPYSSGMRWHHYFGLVFGATTLTWIFSGLLSMDPWGWSPSTTPAREHQLRLAGGAMSASELSAPRIRRALEAYLPRMAKEIEIVKFRGRYYATAAEGVVALDHPHLGAQDQLPPDLVVGAARIVMPDVAISGMRWMDTYDAYYYDRNHQRPLPVLRVRYDDPQQTWLYIDPRHGAIVRKEERLSRINRWLYRGFHSFDFPFLYYRRPLWDIVVIVFSGGGLILAATTLAAAWRRLRRRARRLTASPPSAS